MKNRRPYTITMTSQARVFSAREVMDMTQTERQSWNLQFKAPRLGVAGDGFGRFEATPKPGFPRTYEAVGEIV